METEDFKGRLARMKILIGAIVLFLLLVLPNCFGWPLMQAVKLSSTDKLMPEGTAFVDLLVKSGAGDKYYTAMNSANAEKYSLATDCDIAAYSEDGFVSYTLHIIDSSSESGFYDRSEIEGKTVRKFNASFGDGVSTALQCANYDVLGEYTDCIKVACVGADGRVLYVSDSIKLRPTDFFFTFERLELDSQGVSAVRDPKPALYFPLLAAVVLLACALMIRAFSARKRRKRVS